MLRVGTDCSGIEAPIQALINLKIPFEHVFSSEKDKHAKKSLKENYNPQFFYNDIVTRHNHSIDLYICGFPCQPFSRAGKRIGTEDPRGNIFQHVLLGIKNMNPKYFVLENVKDIMSINGGEYWNAIKNQLSETGYNIYYKVLNTRNYGIPQNRERLYIVGTKKSFTWPIAIDMLPLSDFIEKGKVKENLTVKDQKVRDRIYLSKASFLDLGWRNFKDHSYENYTQCITCSSSMWNLKEHRKATITELLSLQGFPKNFKQVVSDAQLKKQIGNSMSVCVLEHIFTSLLN